MAKLLQKSITAMYTDTHTHLWIWKNFLYAVYWTIRKRRSLKDS